MYQFELEIRLLSLEYLLLRLVPRLVDNDGRPVALGSDGARVLLIQRLLLSDGDVPERGPGRASPAIRHDRDGGLGEESRAGDDDEDGAHWCGHKDAHDTHESHHLGVVGVPAGSVPHHVQSYWSQRRLHERTSIKQLWEPQRQSAKVPGREHTPMRLWRAGDCAAAGMRQPKSPS